MKQKAFIFMAVLALCILSIKIASAEEIKKPQYSDGQWWKVSNQTFETSGISRSACYDVYDTYVIRRQDGEFKIFIFEQARGHHENENPENAKIEIECAEVLWRILGTADSGNQMHLPFPLDLNKPIVFDTTGKARNKVTITGAMRRDKMAFTGRELTVFDLGREVQPLGRQGSIYNDSLVWADECGCFLMFSRKRANDRINLEINIVYTVIDFGITK